MARAQATSCTAGSWPVGVLYERHTPVHHKIYQYDSMAMRSNREFRLVLIPAAGVASRGRHHGARSPTRSRACSTPNCGWLALATSAVYVVAYELSHLAYHLPEDSFIGRLPLVRVLREHHRRHHHPALMQKWNFNVTVPLFDWIHGTLAPTESRSADAVTAPRRRGLTSVRSRIGQGNAEIPRRLARARAARRETDEPRPGRLAVCVGVARREALLAGRRAPRPGATVLEPLVREAAQARVAVAVARAGSALDPRRHRPATRGSHDGDGYRRA